MILKGGNNWTIKLFVYKYKHLVEVIHEVHICYCMQAWLTVWCDSNNFYVIDLNMFVFSFDTIVTTSMYSMAVSIQL